MEFIRVNQEGSSVIIQSQIQSRLTETVASGIVLIVLILAIGAPDPRLARIVDILGSIFVLCFILMIAVGLVKEGLPEILDRSVPDPDHYQILRVLAAHFDQYDGFGGYRTRRSGKYLFIMITLGFFPGTTLAEVQARLEPICQDMESEIPGSKVTIISEPVEDGKSNP